MNVLAVTLDSHGWQSLILHTDRLSNSALSIVQLFRDSCRLITAALQ